MDHGLVISTCPHVVKLIFKNLGPKDLNSCAQVCSLWHSIAKDEKKHRRQIVSFFELGFNLEHSTKCSFAKYEEMEIPVINFMKSFKIEPKFCTLFMTHHLFLEFERFFPTFNPIQPPIQKKARFSDTDVPPRKYLYSIIDAILKPYLPPDCPVTFVVSPGIIGPGAGGVNLEVEEGPALTGLLQPDIPGMRAQRFSIQNKRSDLAGFLSGTPDVKAVIMFLSPRGASHVNHFAKSCCEGCPDIALGGAIVDRTESLMGTAIVFSGKNIEAASVIISPSDRETEVENKLKQFGETGLMQNECFAYMFACVGRGTYMYFDRGVESGIFSKMYPNVPITGVFGNGEIGVDYLPNVTEDNDGSKPRKLKPKKYLYSYTTIFLVVSIKNKNFEE